MGVSMTIRSRTPATPDDLARVQALVDAEAPADGWHCIDPPIGILSHENGASTGDGQFVFFIPKIWLAPEDTSLAIGPDDIDAIQARSAHEMICLLRGLQQAARELKTQWRVGCDDWMGVLGPAGPDEALSPWLDALKQGGWDYQGSTTPMNHWKEPWTPSVHTGGGARVKQRGGRFWDRWIGRKRANDN